MSLIPRAAHEMDGDAETMALAEQVLPKTHPYRVLREALGAVYRDEDFADLFGRQGPQAVSPGMLALVTVLQFAEGLTDRQAADAVRSRIDWKYMLGLKLNDTGFDASVLSEFRGRLAAGRAGEQLLDRVLALFKAHGALKDHRRQRTDSTHVLDAVRTLSRLELVGEALRHSLNDLAAVIPEWLQARAPEDWYVRYGERFEDYRLPKSAQARIELGEEIGRDGAMLLRWLYDDAQVACLRSAPAVEALRQIWVQNFTLTDSDSDPDEEDARIVVQWRCTGNLPPGARQISSPYDIQARFSIKRGFEWMGYKVHLTETCVDGELDVITDVLTTSATTGDVEVTEHIHQRLIDKQLKPEEHVVDTGYASAEHLVNSLDQGIEMITRVLPDHSFQATHFPAYALAHFDIDWERNVVTCPHGHTSKSWSQADPTAPAHVRFDPRDCAECPARSMCIRGAAPARTLELQPRRRLEALLHARAYQASAHFKARYAIRSGIEATLSQGVRAFNLRCARYIGLAKTHLQELAVASAINLKRFARWFATDPDDRQRASVRPPPRFARLRPAT